MNLARSGNSLLRASVRFLPALAIAAIGGIAAQTLGLPVGLLIGSSIAVATANLAGMKLGLPSPLRSFAFFILGLQAGAGVNPETIRAIALWPFSFFILSLTVVAVTAATFVFLRLATNWDRSTAFFASLPGALSFVLAAASGTRANVASVAIVQSVRLMFLIAVLGPLLALVAAPTTAPVNGGDSLQPAELLLLFGAGLVGMMLGEKSGIPGGGMLGALVVSAALNGTSVISATVPAPLAIGATILLGILIGGRFSRETRSELLRLLPIATLAVLIGLATAAVGGLIVHAVLGTQIATLALAYAPGALEALTVIAYSLGLDPAFVAAHHVFRFLAIATIVPFLARWLAARPPLGEQVD